MIRTVLIFATLALIGCSPTTIEKVTKVYPNGQPESIMFYVEGEEHPSSQKVYYSDGKLKIEGTFKNGLRDGKWTSYYDNGNIWTVNNYLEDANHGEYFMYNQDGSLKLQGFYEHGEETGVWIINDESGNLIEERSFN